MAFHIDVLPIRFADGSLDVIEIDYTVDDCVRAGWLDPETSIWIRKEIQVPIPTPDEGDEPYEFEGGPWSDRTFGQDLQLKLVQTSSGKWIADFGNIRLK